MREHETQILDSDLGAAGAGDQVVTWRVALAQGRRAKGDNQKAQREDLVHGDVSS